MASHVIYRRQPDVYKKQVIFLEFLSFQYRTQQSLNNLHPCSNFPNHIRHRLPTITITQFRSAVSVRPDQRFRPGGTKSNCRQLRIHIPFDTTTAYGEMCSALITNYIRCGNSHIVWAFCTGSIWDRVNRRRVPCNDISWYTVFDQHGQCPFRWCRRC